MYGVKTKVVLRKYLQTYMWESLEEWNKRINQAIRGLDIISISPIGFDGVLIVYVDNGEQWRIVGQSKPITVSNHCSSGTQPATPSSQ